jgi:hypothetical protein
MLKFWNTAKKESAGTPVHKMERRLVQRRVGADRREMIRFEPGKNDRRLSDRRSDCNIFKTVTTADLCRLN